MSGCQSLFYFVYLFYFANPVGLIRIRYCFPTFNTRMREFPASKPVLAQNPTYVNYEAFHSFIVT